jgi:2-polyprenyl-3-methyl-5-hydroxy-6-metoxy-1,4-benzoquinol methylase
MGSTHKHVTNGLAKPMLALIGLGMLILVTYATSSKNDRNPITRVRDGFGHSRDRDNAALLKARLEYVERATTTLRQQLFKAICASTQKVSGSGAWCLYETNKTVEGYDYPMAHFHIKADEGIASTVASVVKPGMQLLDLGCGIGQYGQLFKQQHVPFVWEGYDGAVNVEMYTHGFVKWADMSVPGFATDGGRADWVLALEIGEHVPEMYESIVIDNIDRNNKCGAIVSWAIPGQGGHEHINEQPNSRIIDHFVRRGYTYDADKSKEGRESAQYRWFRNSFMVFRRDSAQGEC